MGWDLERFVNKDNILGALICSICTDVIQEPVQTPCEHCFCKSCITQWLRGGQKSCPEDRKPLNLSMLKKPNRMTIQVLNDLEIRCKYFEKGCTFTTKLENNKNLIHHETNECVYSILDDPRVELIAKEGLEKLIASSQSIITTQEELRSQESRKDKYCNRKYAIVSVICVVTLCIFTVLSGYIGRATWTECTQDVQCPRSRPVCFENECFECTNDSNCLSEDKSVCSKNTCVECVTDKNCSFPKPYCTENSCVECIDTCDNICIDNVCLECIQSSDCPDYKPICSDNICIACFQDNECPDTKPICNSEKGCVECNTVSDCPRDKAACLENACLDCLQDQDCQLTEKKPICCIGPPHNTPFCCECMNDSNCPQSSPFCLKDNGTCYGDITTTTVTPSSVASLSSLLPHAETTALVITIYIAFKYIFK